MSLPSRDAHAGRDVQGGDRNHLVRGGDRYYLGLRRADCESRAGLHSQLADWRGPSRIAIRPQNQDIPALRFIGNAPHDRFAPQDRAQRRELFRKVCHNPEMGRFSGWMHDNLYRPPAALLRANVDPFTPACASD